MGPPNVLLAPNPTSSVKIKRTFGAPFGASTLFGKSGVESFTVRPILPWKGDSGFGSTLSWAKAQATGALIRISASVKARVICLTELLLFGADPNADAAASVVAPSSVLCRVTATGAFILSS